MEKIYEILVGERERDARRYWTIFGVLSVINSGLFGLVAATGPAREFVQAACLLGTAVCLLWIGGALRMAAWIRWWENRLERLEPEYFASLRQGEADAAAGRLPSWFKVFEGRRLELGFNGFSTRWIGWMLPALFLLIWIALFWLEMRTVDLPPPIIEPVSGSFL